MGCGRRHTQSSRRFSHGKPAHGCQDRLRDHLLRSAKPRPIPPCLGQSCGDPFGDPGSLELGQCGKDMELEASQLVSCSRSPRPG